METSVNHGQVTEEESEGEHVEGAVDARESGVLVPRESDVTPTISVVMPTLNEEDGVGECIERTKCALSELGVRGEIIVSDSSDDRTPEIAADMGAFVVNPDEPGYGYAYRYAFEHVRGEYVMIGDADTTYDCEELPKLFRLVAEEGADMAIGSRLNGEIKPGAMPALHQYVGNPLLTWFLNLFYDAGVSDAHSGFRVIRTETLRELELNSNGMEFASEMIMEVGARDLEIAEEPITYYEREGEATLDSFRDGWRHVKFMLLNAPGYLFSAPGAVMSLVGVLIMLMAFSSVGISSVGLGARSMIAGSLLTLVGVQVTSLGVFATVTSDPIRRPEDPLTEGFLKRVRLEHGATAGLLLSAAGGAYAALLFGRWASGGVDQLPSITTSIATLTLIVLGLQVVFGSFFLSSIVGHE